MILREEEYVQLLQVGSREFGQWVAAIAAEPGSLTNSGTLARLLDTAHTLETFLDDHGARQNRTYVTFREMVASTRGLATIKATGLHLLNRLPRYQTMGETAGLVSKLQEGHGILDEALMALIKGIVDESRRLGLTWNSAPFRPGDQLDQRQLLPRNLDAEASVDEQQHIAEIGGRFLAVLEGSRSLDLDHVRPAGELADFVALHATEERCRGYESAVHNIQSMYDTYVLHTAMEEEHPWLRCLRGNASVALHLLEMATGLVHFYERHENDIRHEPAREAISALVSKEKILQLAVNVCLREAYLTVEAAAGLAGRILETFVAERSVALSMPDGVSLHARPLALIVQIARRYGTPMEVTIEGESCAANSLMGLIMLGGRHPRPKAFEIRGAARAVADVQLLFEAGLGETAQALPPELDYLRTAS